MCWTAAGAGSCSCESAPSRALQQRKLGGCLECRGNQVGVLSVILGNLLDIKSCAAARAPPALTLQQRSLGLACVQLHNCGILPFMPPDNIA